MSGIVQDLRCTKRGRIKRCKSAYISIMAKLSTKTKCTIVILRTYKIAKLTMIVQKAITKSSVGQHGPPTNAKVGSDHLTSVVFSAVF
jgi:hypothetical protein